MTRRHIAALTATVTIGLVAGLVGAAAAALVAFGCAFYFFGSLGPIDSLVSVASLLGFGVSGLLAPLLTWVTLRHVPIWRAATEIGFAATVAFIATLLLTEGSVSAAAVWAMVVGEGAAGRLWYAFRYRDRYVLQTPAPSVAALPSGPVRPRSTWTRWALKRLGGM